MNAEKIAELERLWIQVDNADRSNDKYEKWLNFNMELNKHAADLIATAKEVERLKAERDELHAAIRTANQALLEVRHAQLNGPEWYTRGESGLRQQVAMWVQRGLEAIAKVSA